MPVQRSVPLPFSAGPEFVTHEINASAARRHDHRHLGVNFSVIKLGLQAVDPFILAGIRFTLCALPALFFIKKPDVPWRYLISYGLVFGIGLWGLVNLGIKTGLSAGIASLLLQFSAFFTLLLGGWVFKSVSAAIRSPGVRWPAPVC